MAPPLKHYLMDKGYDTGGAVTQYRAMKFSGRGAAGALCNQVTAINDIVCGISQEEVLSAEQLRGKGVPVTHLGITPLECAAAVSEGQLVQVTANGRGTPFVGAGAARILGICVVGCTFVGNNIYASIIFTPGLALS